MRSLQHRTVLTAMGVIAAVGVLLSLQDTNADTPAATTTTVVATTMPATTTTSTTTTTTTIPATTTTVDPQTYVHFYPDVERWHDLAMLVGWKESEWKWLSCILYRESRGQPDVRTTQHYGLMQIASRVHAARIERAGGNAQMLFDPAFNLTLGLELYREQGERPWTPKCQS